MGCEPVMRQRTPDDVHSVSACVLKYYSLARICNLFVPEARPGRGCRRQSTEATRAVREEGSDKGSQEKSRRGPRLFGLGCLFRFQISRLAFWRRVGRVRGSVVWLNRAR